MRRFKKMYGIIYKITNSINGKIYIGQTAVSIEQRFNGHKIALEAYKEDKYKHKSHLYNAMSVYGFENFYIEQIDSADSPEELNELEKYYIENLNTRDDSIGYNIAPGGFGGPLFEGHSHSDETKKKMSEDRMGENNANFGNRWSQSDELKALHSELSTGEGNGMWGKHHKDSTKRLIGEKNKIQQEDRIKVTNGIEEHQIKIDDLEYYESLGYWHGTKPRKKRGNTKVWVSNGIDEFKVPKEQLDEYLQKGFVHKRLSKAQRLSKAELEEKNL